jgi:hypothetical protein
LECWVDHVAGEIGWLISFAESGPLGNNDGNNLESMGCVDVRMHRHGINGEESGVGWQPIRKCLREGQMQLFQVFHMRPQKI